MSANKYWWWVLGFFGGALAAGAGAWQANANANVADPSVIAVEEDWSLSISEPDAKTGSPQIGLQMTPDASVESTFGVFNVNFQQLPDFVEGGIEIQFWEGDWNIDVNGEDKTKLANSEETLTWTQFMKVQDGKVRFGVKDGKSQSFDDFGGSSFFVESKTGFSNLNGYNAENSVKNSGVTLGSNRVKSLKLLCVRKIKSDNSVETDNNVKVVFEKTVDDAAN